MLFFLFEKKYFCESSIISAIPISQEYNCVLTPLRKIICEWAPVNKINF